MSKKKSEKYFRDMVNSFEGIHARKYGDVRYCIHCQKPLPKTETAPDFGLGGPWTWVECKNNPDSSPRWNWSEIAEEGGRANQRKFMIENGGWLFIVLGRGRAPMGKSAYLIHIQDWIHCIEPTLNKLNQKSIRRQGGRGIGGDILLHDWKLEWVDGKFVPPCDHVWWKAYKIALNKQLEWVERIIDG